MQHKKREKSLSKIFSDNKKSLLKEDSKISAPSDSYFDAQKIFDFRAIHPITTGIIESIVDQLFFKIREDYGVIKHTETDKKYLKNLSRIKLILSNILILEFTRRCNDYSNLIDKVKKIEIIYLETKKKIEKLEKAKLEAKDERKFIGFLENHLKELLEEELIISLMLLYSMPIACIKTSNEQTKVLRGLGLKISHYKPKGKQGDKIRVGLLFAMAGEYKRQKREFGIKKPDVTKIAKLILDHFVALEEIPKNHKYTVKRLANLFSRASIQKKYLSQIHFFKH